MTMVDTLKEVAEQSDDEITSTVRDYAQNVEVILGQKGRLAAHAKGKTIIMRTLHPETTNGLGEKVEAESDFTLISAAVSGGHSGAVQRGIRDAPVHVHGQG
ncbi:hypothetical protein FJ970_32715 (plasmid) [Mesorhizobium sp. B2-1-8]|nr:hypothetical protein FJ970_32715 [Mesorhizobium sp. B2-1-8]